MPGGRQWIQTFVLGSHFNSGIFVSTFHGKKLMLAASFCHSFSNCALFCQEKDGTFTLWRIIADPFLENDAQGTAKKCWTSEEQGNFIPQLTGASASGRNTPSHHPLRTPGNLIDGVYSGTYDDTGMVIGTDPYFLIDLGEEVIVKKIKLRPNYVNVHVNRFHKITVRIGDVPKTGDFSTYEELGYYQGPYSGKEFIWSFEVDPPVSGRYVSIQKASTVHTILQIGHLQIYLER